MKKYVFLLLLIILKGCGSIDYENEYLDIDLSEYLIEDTENHYINDIFIESEKEFNNYFDNIYYEMEDEYYQRIKNHKPERIILGAESSEPIFSEPYRIEIDNYGTLVYKIDTLFTIGITSRVEARIIKIVDEQTTQNLMSLTHKSSTGKIQSVIIKVGDVMDMELISLDKEAFNIVKIGDGNQPIDYRYIAYWIWGITPLKVGEFDILLRAIIREDNINKNLTIFDNTITVNSKPKKNYRYELVLPDNLKRFEKSTILLNIYEDENYDFQWGGKGKISLEFDKNIKIEPNNIYYIDYNKGIFRYRWLVEPAENDEETKFILRIIGDYEELIVEDGYIKIKRNFNESFNRFVDVILKRWYFLLSSLIIPFYIYIKKKYFKKEEEKK